MSDSSNNSEVRLRARLHRNLRTAILASRRTPDTGQIARRRRALRRHFLTVTRRAAASSNSHDLNAIRSLFSSLRNRQSSSANTSRPIGVYAFNDPNLHIPQTTSFRFPVLHDHNNITCTHCGAQLWREERILNCCKSGAAVIPRLRPVSDHIWRLFSSKEFSNYQRKCNRLFSFTALGAGGCDNRTWTDPKPPSMLTLHGKAYHRIFDLQEQYENMKVHNSVRFYIYDSELLDQAERVGVDLSLAETLRNHVHENILWAWQYRAAVDDVNNPKAVSSEPAFISFAEASRVNDGNVPGQEVTAPEIAAILYTSGEEDITKRSVITYPQNSPDFRPRFLPLWSPAYETLHYPLLFMHGEAGWSPGHPHENPPKRSRTMNVAGDSHVTLPFYCRQRFLCERVFQRNSRIAQEWITDSLSRSEEDQLTCIESEPIQKRLATARSISQTSSTEKPGQLLPVSFHGPPAKRKHDTEDALAVVNRKGKPHLMITMTCNPLWPEIVQNLLPGQQASDRPDLCCRVFKLKLAVLMSHLKSGNVFGPYDYHMSAIEYQKRGLPQAHVIVKFKNAGPDILNQMDSWVWAQLPDASIAGGELREMVLKYMIHKPCGHHNVDAPCMQTYRDTSTKSCNNYYPQPFRTTATLNDRSGRAEYCRTRNDDNPTIRNKVGNSWVDVPVGNQ